MAYTKNMGLSFEWMFIAPVKFPGLGRNNADTAWSKTYHKIAESKVGATDVG